MFSFRVPSSLVYARGAKSISFERSLILPPFDLLTFTKMTAGKFIVFSDVVVKASPRVFSLSILTVMNSMMVGTLRAPAIKGILTESSSVCGNRKRLTLEKSPVT